MSEATIQEAAWIRFLIVFRWIALVLLILSFLGFGIYGWALIVFCDQGPTTSNCFFWPAVLWSIPVVQLAFFIISWILFRKRRHILLSGVLMLLSVMPAIGLIVEFLQMGGLGVGVNMGIGG